MSRRKWKYIVVDVTQEAIDNGHKLSSTSDPIALSLKALGYKKVNVGVNAVVFDGKHPVDIPQKAKNFIRSYDRKRKVKPFVFKMKLDINSPLEVYAKANTVH